MVFRCVSEARPALGRRIPGTGAATRWGGRAATRGKGEGLVAGDRAAITLQQPRSPRLCSQSGRGGTTANKAHKVQGPRPRGRRSACFLRSRPARTGGAGLRRPGGGVRSGPASIRACEPRSAWPPGLFWGLQVSWTIEGLRRLSSGSGHLSDLRSICPAVCQQPSPQKNGRTKGGGGPGVPKEIQGPRYPAPPADTFGFSPSHRCRPRDPGPVLGAAASSPLPVRLCFCVCLAVPELVPLQN